MATAENLAEKSALRKPQKPFYFNNSEHLLRIGRQRASDLSALLQALQTVPDDCIFQHTFRTLQEHHFIRQGFSNDFAHWSLFACNEPALAEQFASVDVREFTAIEGLRRRMVEILDEFLQSHNMSGSRPAHEPFYFCAAETVVIPTPYRATTLPEFADGLRKVTLHSIHFHFINARLRIKLNSNDFSIWLEQELGLTAVADRLNQIDIYTATLQDVRRAIQTIVERGLRQ